MTKSSKNIINMVIAAFFLALALVLPFLTAQVPTVGKMLCPMHLPVFLCAYFCGPFYALVVGIIAPLLRMLLFGMPNFLTAIPMCFELAAYGFFAGILYKKLPKKNVYIYVSLIAAMILGRIVWGIAKAVLVGLGAIDFGFKAFIVEGFVTALPGIALQIVVVPLLVIALRGVVVHSHDDGTVHMHLHGDEPHKHDK